MTTLSAAFAPPESPPLRQTIGRRPPPSLRPRIAISADDIPSFAATPRDLALNLAALGLRAAVVLGLLVAVAIAISAA